jgi:hypothetical protein
MALPFPVKDVPLTLRPVTRLFDANLIPMAPAVAKPPSVMVTALTAAAVVTSTPARSDR